MKKKFKKVLASAMAGIMALSVMMSPGLGTKVAKAASAVEYEEDSIDINKVSYNITFENAGAEGITFYGIEKNFKVLDGTADYPCTLDTDISGFDNMGYVDSSRDDETVKGVVNSITFNDSIVFELKATIISQEGPNGIWNKWNFQWVDEGKKLSKDGKYILVCTGSGEDDKISIHKVSEDMPPTGPFLDITLEQADNGIAIISADEAQMFQYVYLTQEADDGYGFKEWKVETDEETPTAIEVKNNKFKMPGKPVKVTPVFAKKYAIKVTDDGNGTGEASVDSEIAGKEVTLTAKPNAGYKLNEWKVVKGEATVTGDTLTLTKDADVEVQALFEKQTGEYAYINFADGKWNHSHWTDTDPIKTEKLVDLVNGGKYSVKVDLVEEAVQEKGSATSLQVLCLDIPGAAATIASNKLILKSMSIKLDGKDYPVDKDKVLTGDLEDKNTYRLEIFNTQRGTTAKTEEGKNDKGETVTTYPNSPVGDPANFTFSKSMEITFEIGPNTDTTERDIKVTTSGKGTASASVAKAMFGTEVTLTAKPDEGYYFKGWEVKSGNVKISEDNKFTMQNAAVEIEAVFAENPKVDTSKPADYHAYMCFQTPAYTFRNAWSDADYGLNGKNLLKDGYNVAYGWDNGNQVVKPGKFTDVNITKDGTYTVSVTDMDTTYEFESQKFMNLIFVSTDIPNVDSIKITDVVLKVNGKEVKVSPVLDPKDKDYKQLICQSTYYKNGDDVPVLECGEYDVPVKSIEVTFTVTGVENLVLPAKKGASVKTAEGTFKVTSTDVNAPTVAFTAPKSKTATSVTIPATIKDENGVTYKVTSVAANAFAKNTKVKKVEIGKNVKTIGAGAFSGCTKLATVTFKGTAVTSIGKNAFKGDKALKSIVITKKVKTIGASAFEGCTKLAKVTMKSTKLATVGNKAFAKCTALKSLIFPATCKKLGASVFTGDKKLKTLTLKSTKITTKTLNKNTFKGTVKTIKVKVPSKKVAAYKKLFATKGLNKKAKVTK